MQLSKCFWNSKIAYKTKEILSQSSPYGITSVQPSICTTHFTVIWEREANFSAWPMLPLN
eukprot:2315496-Pleurochrysis_carterae.AAC.1